MIGRQLVLDRRKESGAARLQDRSSQVPLLTTPGSSLIVTVLRQTLRRWAWSGPGQAWFSLDLPLAGEAAPPAQHVGPPDAMIGNLGLDKLLEASRM